MSKIFIYEFLFRGGATSKPGDDTWHVILAREVEGIDGKIELQTAGPFTPAQAAEQGFPLTKIVEEMNLSAIHELDEHRRVTAELVSALEAESAVKPAPAPAKRSLLNKLSFGLIK